jgi:15-cis-phytoene synthase
MRESRRITRKSASNLALAFALLPSERREAMSALYAFCRQVDDVADEDHVPLQQRRAQLHLWRQDIRRAFAAEQPEFPVNRELQPVIRRYNLQLEYFEALLDGVEMDLETIRYSSWETLDLYCYRVASVVGLLSIEIFGYKDPVCRNYAVHLGKALQLTNILRDVHDDARRGRIYLPESELHRFAILPEQILEGRWSPEYRELAASVAARAEEFYGLARSSLPPAERPAMVASELMAAVYWRLLLKLKNADYNVFQGRRIRLTRPEKLSMMAGAWLGFSLARKTPGYGPSRKA